MLLVGWILYAPFGRCYRWGGFLMHRSVDVIVGCISCIVNVFRCAERTLRVCSWWGKFLMHRSVDVIVGCILCIINYHGGCYR
jgi:hypothetical protein